MNNSAYVRIEIKSVQDAICEIKEGRYRLNRKLKRDLVWQSEIIESCVMGIPLPVFYLAHRDGEIVLADGLQRLATLKRYIAGEFSLTGDNALYGKRFIELPIKTQEQIKSTQLTFHILSEKVPESFLALNF